MRKLPETKIWLIVMKNVFKSESIEWSVLQCLMLAFWSLLISLISFLSLSCCLFKRSLFWESLFWKSLFWKSLLSLLVHDPSLQFSPFKSLFRWASFCWCLRSPWFWFKFLFCSNYLFLSASDISKIICSVRSFAFYTSHSLFFGKTQNALKRDAKGNANPLSQAEQWGRSNCRKAETYLCCGDLGTFHTKTYIFWLFEHSK